MMEYLDGGRKNKIIRNRDVVHRPAGTWTPTIHRLLKHIRSKGFFGGPKPIGIDDQGNEMISYIPGEVSNYPLSDGASSMDALVSAAELLRSYHDVTTSFVRLLTGKETWYLSVREPVEVICHGDYAPYNVVLDGNRAVAIIDFDTAHPGPRTWDIAYALYRWGPLHSPDNPDGFGREQQKIHRCRQFCDSYGLSIPMRDGLITTVIQRLDYLVSFMHSEADAGNEAFKANLSDGHHLGYLADIDYLKSNIFAIQAGLQ